MAAGRGCCPSNNCREFDSAHGTARRRRVDISAGFQLWSADPGGNGASYLLGLEGYCLPYGAQITSLKVGVETADTLAPAFFAAIARITGSLYENREASAELMASGFDDELAALWRPDV